MTEQVIVLRTGRLHEFEMACNALTESGIPFFKQQEISGVKTALYAPAAGPGTFWNILVPVSMKQEAEKILKELPIENTTEPDLWHFGGKPYAKKVWKILALIFLTGMLCLWILSYVQNIKQGYQND